MSTFELSRHRFLLKILNAAKFGGYIETLSDLYLSDLEKDSRSYWHNAKRKLWIREMKDEQDLI